ncbi:hypothetical protein [Patulibacter minatonensis]|uniref:hypothetical protein n=1 Tax=Patulibacter minatonensis TaxID=298163 RepID=UPI00047CA315|nr:hypothetical protein [Patulibacter minatonensis]
MPGSSAHRCGSSTTSVGRRGPGRPAGVLALAAGIAAAAVPATAAADPVVGPSIASGVSASGQAWRQRAAIDGPTLQLETSFPMGRHGDGGGFLSVPWRSHARLAVSQGSGFGTADEWEVDGVVYRTVARVRVTTIDGRTTTFRPRRAPRAAIRRYPQLARYRFFVRFFPNDRQPLTVEALSPRGRAMAEQRVGLP